MRFPYEGSFLAQNPIWLNTPGKALMAMIDNPNAQPDADGNKYIKAGTLVGGTGDFKLDAEGDVVVQPVTDPTQAQGILVNDVDISREAPHTCSVAIRGVINIHFMYDDVKAVYTPQVVQQLRQTLPNLEVVDRY